MERLIHCLHTPDINLHKESNHLLPMRLVKF